MLIDAMLIVLALSGILYVLDECVNKLKRTRGLCHLWCMSWRERLSTLLRGIGWLLLSLGAAGAFTMLLPGDDMPADWLRLGYALTVAGLALVMLQWRVDEPPEPSMCDPESTRPLRDPFQQTQVLRR